MFIVRELKTHPHRPSELSPPSQFSSSVISSRTRSAGAGTNSSAVLARTQFFASGAFLHPARTPKSHSLKLDLASAVLLLSVRRLVGSLYSWLVARIGCSRIAQVRAFCGLHPRELGTASSSWKRLRLPCGLRARANPIKARSFAR